MLSAHPGPPPAVLCHVCMRGSDSKLVVKRINHLSLAVSVSWTRPPTPTFYPHGSIQAVTFIHLDAARRSLSVSVCDLELQTGNQTVGQSRLLAEGKDF